MLLERITLHNFRAFRGRHDLDLAPSSPEKPIVLVMGLNGAGKTTLLEALHLVLYGKKTPSPRRSQQAYERYLEECRHRGNGASEDAGVELRFSQVIEGEPLTFELCRSWSTTRNGVRESLRVAVNGIEDTVLRDDWGQYIEELLPARLAPLFFFDGEKIESLADLEATAQVLSVAIHSLLGLDLVDQLHNDLEVLERKRAAEDVDGDLREELEALEATKEEAFRAERKVYEERASVQSELDQARQRYRRAQRKFESRGGAAFEKRHELEVARRQAEQAVDESRVRLRELASGYAPLLLVPELMERVAAQVTAERAARENHLLSQILEERDEAFLRDLATASADSPLWIEGARVWLERDRQERRNRDSVEQALQISEAGASQLDHLQATDLPNLKEQLRERLARHQTLEGELEKAEKRLAAVPEEGSLRELRSARDAAQEEVSRLQALLSLREEAFEAAKRVVADADKRLKAAHLRNVAARKKHSTKRRLVEHSARVRSTLSVFREKMLYRHIERIEELILEGLHRLLRKERLVSGLKISPEDFTVELFGADEEPLPPELLSAGERQLLAVSILWGLARAARRPMPTLIDTPLGRLDSVHRRHLVDRYFPFASHQVILLSTDEEISGSLLESLRPKIEHFYLLEHDDATGTSAVVSEARERMVAS